MMRLWMLGPIALALFGQRLMLQRPAAAWGLIILAGFWAAFSWRRIGPEPGGIKTLAAPAQGGGRLELAFFALLLLALIGTRFYQLNDLPAGAVNYEGQVALRLGILAVDPYTVHDTDPINAWPSLIHSQALAATKALGWSPMALRVPSALWGILTVLVLYVVVRQASSWPTALLFGLLMVVNGEMFLFSRRLFPGVLTTAAALAALAFFRMGMRDRRGLWFIAAGVAAGVGFHGFYPGRGLVPLFGLWALWLIAFYRRDLPSWRHMGLFFGAFALVIAPVVLWALQHPGAYWGWVNRVNAAGGRGLSGALKAVSENWSAYAKAFHAIPDGDWRMDYHLDRPWLDPFTALFFGLGVGMLLLQFWKPLPFFLLLALAGGIAPALLSAHPSHPVARRALMAIPVAFVIAAYAFERFRRNVLPEQLRHWALAVAAVLLAGFSGQRAWSALQSLERDAINQSANGYTSYAAWKASLAHPGAQLHGNPRINYGEVAPFFFSPHNDLRMHAHLEDQLCVPGNSDHLMFMRPYASNLKPILAERFQGAKIVDYPLGHSADMNPTLVEGSEGVYLDGALTTVFVPGGFGAQLTRLDAGVPTRVELADAAWLAAAAGHRVRLAGSFVLPDLKPVDLSVGLGLPGAQAWIDGRAVALGSAKAFDGGIHWLRLEFTVPRGLEALPLTLRSNGRDLIAENRLLPLYRPWGGTLSILARNDPGAPLHLSRQEISLTRSFNEDFQVVLPTLARFTARVDLPVAGEWQVRVRYPFMARVQIDGVTAFDSIVSRDQPRTASLKVASPGSKRLVVEAVVEPAHERFNTLLTELKRPGATAWEPLDPTWVRPEWSAASR